MIDFHAVLIDETGCEFGVSFKAATRGAALEYLQEQYPESRCDQLEDPQDTERRQAALYAQGCMAFSVIAVSISVSPFFTEDWDDYSDEDREEMMQRRAEAEEAAQDGMYM